MGQQASDQLIQDLEQNHDFMRQRIQKFSEVVNADSIRLPMTCFYETKKTEMLRKLVGSAFTTKLSSKYTNKLVSYVH
jgi:hypothetical protein